MSTPRPIDYSLDLLDEATSGAAMQLARKVERVLAAALSNPAVRAVDFADPELFSQGSIDPPGTYRLETWFHYVFDLDQPAVGPNSLLSVTRYVLRPDPVDPPLPDVRGVPMGRNDAGAETIGQYLSRLLSRVWDEEEEFDGKRPFGNSGWQSEVYAALDNSEFAAGGYVTSSHEYNELIREAIRLGFEP